MAITYLKGDATLPQASGPKIIAHIVNTAGGWGAGFVVAISNRWPEPERAYRLWHRQGPEFRLGALQMVPVEPDLWVANMVAQFEFGTSGNPPIRYDALSTCLAKLAVEAQEKGAAVHAPRIGCGLAGGTWDKVEPLINEALQEVPVYIYDFGG